MGRVVPLAIVNPQSGGSRRADASLQGALERGLGPVDVVLTQGPGHAIDLARRGVEERRELIVAVGGDGTLHEVVNGVLDAGGGAAVGLVGRGTGGDFRRTLGLENRLDAYVQAVAAGRERTLDVGRVRYRAPDGTTQARWFLNVLSVGMGGLVDRYVARTTKVLGGRAAYFLASLRALARCRRARIRCAAGLGEGARDERHLDTFMIAVCNGRYFGAGMHVAPMAAPDDGRFEVVSMDAPGKLAFVTFSRKIYDGSHVTTPGVTHFACDRIAIDLEDDRARDVFLLDVDGEALGGVPVEVELVPRALRFRG
ncbi:MAG TPA: YegS/Rv2252/BmrU family lipid kinase [Polyangiaceae bacterium]|nr:YegS/Rv2252/BmrU family lipid kinase [Polyangiaceae bacterium]